MNQPETNEAGFNRRDFLKGGSVATMMAMMGGVELFAQAVPEKKDGDKPPGPAIKCALIGLGPWGREILDLLNRIPQTDPHAEIVALCDNYPAMMRRSAAKAPGAAQLEDYQAVLANKDIQAVIIATGSHQHKDIAVAALKAGKHVYCEAPLANTVEDAKAIGLAARGAVGKVFQPGLQARSDPQRHFLLPFIRSGALGKSLLARAQWHKKQSWRAASPNAEREKTVNWRLSKATSTGLVGEIGIHQLDQAGWFLNGVPTAVTGFGSLAFWRDDGRDVPDTVQLVVEYPEGVRLSYDATLANSFDADYEMYFGSDAAVMIRESKAWMFKEVDSPLLGWEVYARKDAFYKETGIALVAGGSKQDAMADKSKDDAAKALPPLYYALQSFLGNCVEVTAAVDDFTASFGSADKKALAENLAGIKLRNAANYKDGYAATVLAIKANEAITTNSRIELKKEWFELA
jgi:predicted dehydrogenase